MCQLWNGLPVWLIGGTPVLALCFWLEENPKHVGNRGLGCWTEFGVRGMEDTRTRWKCTSPNAINVWICLVTLPCLHCLRLLENRLELLRNRRAIAENVSKVRCKLKLKASKSFKKQAAWLKIHLEKSSGWHLPVSFAHLTRYFCGSGLQPYKQAVETCRDISPGQEIKLFSFYFRSFPLHFDENSLFAGNKKEAAKLKVIGQPFPLGHFLPKGYFQVCVWDNTRSDRDPSTRKVPDRVFLINFAFWMVWILVGNYRL